MTNGSWKKCFPCCLFYMNMQYNPSWMTYAVYVFFFFLNLNHYGNHCTRPLHTPSVTVNGSKYIHLINQQCAYHHALDLSTERIAVYNDCATSARFCNNVREAIITSDRQSKLWLIIAHISLIYRKNHVRKMINNVVHSTINKNRFTLQ